MQDDEKEANGGQPEPEIEPTSGGEVNADQPDLEKEPEPAPSPPTGRPPLTQRERKLQYFLGLGLGLIPLFVWLIFYGIGTGQSNTGPNYLSGLTTLLGGIFIAGLLYLIELVVTIGYLVSKQRRLVGYGLLTAFLTTPVVIAIGCTVVLRRP